MSILANNLVISANFVHTYYITVSGIMD